MIYTSLFLFQKRGYRSTPQHELNGAIIEQYQIYYPHDACPGQYESAAHWGDGSSCKKEYDLVAVIADREGRISAPENRLFFNIEK